MSAVPFPSHSQVDLDAARRFLTTLDEEAEAFTFQTFADAENADEAQKRELARIIHGPLDAAAGALCRLNERGAGIYVMVNTGDLEGRTAENVVGVRALFADFDGTPLPAVWPLEPNIIVESSPGKWHAYWLASGLELSEFTAFQSTIASRFGSDPAVKDLPRVMRLPGFLHQKGAPFLSRIVYANAAQPYQREDLVRAFGEARQEPPPKARATTEGKIAKGGRNDTLTRMAGAMRRRGMSQDAIVAALSAENAARCDPPLPEADIRTIAGSVSRYAPAEQVVQHPTPLIRPPLNWSSLAAQTPPERRWAIKYWLGFGHTTLLIGAGGIGKTLLAQQMASALALGRGFIDEVPKALKVLIWACEDDHDELWRRQVSIAQWLGAGLEAFQENLLIVPRHGLDNALVSSEYGRPMVTPLVAQLGEQAHDCGAEVVILDNAAQLYGGSENDRHSVTWFLNTLAGALPGKALCLLAHPSRSAGSEYSGSSAWENTARTRLYLGERLPDQKPNPDEEPTENVRYLARRKANYSNRDWRRFNYRDGVLVPEAVEASGGIVAQIREQNAERAVLEGLKRLQGLGIAPIDGRTSPRYLPRLMAEYKLTEGHSTQELGGAMRRLMLDNRLQRGVVGKNENRTKKEGLVIP